MIAAWGAHICQLVVNKEVARVVGLMNKARERVACVQLALSASARLSAIKAKQKEDRLAQLSRRQLSTALCQTE